MKLLFICTHNRCRSILCEAIARERGAGVLLTASAGSAPAESVHPLTLQYLQARGYSTHGLSSKAWHDVEGFTPDRVVTVCDSAAGEACPIWLGGTEKTHWGLPDPSRVDGDEHAVHAAFMSVIDRIEQQVDLWRAAAQA